MLALIITVASVWKIHCQLYDAILNSRMVAWSKPYPEQAGAQSGRGCEEQISALRLSIDNSDKGENHPLFIICPLCQGL